MTLIDLAADRRAPTPTAAAEIAVPVRADLMERTHTLEHRLGASFRRLIAERRARVDGLGRGLPAARDRLTTASQRLDDWSERLARGVRGRLGAERQAVGRLRPLRPAPAPRPQAPAARARHRSPLGRAPRPAHRPSAPGERPASRPAWPRRAGRIERAGGTGRDRGAAARKLFLSGRSRARLRGRARPAGAARDQCGSG